MTLSDDELRERLSGQSWTSHDIRLSPEIMTIPEGADFLETDLRLRAIERTLTVCYGGNLQGRRIADLGCLEGGFSLAFALKGASVLGIEARAANLEKALLLREHFELPNLEFRLGDVKDFNATSHGMFDVVLALGILYHLDDPAAWIRQIAQATSDVLIVDSHFAPADEAALALLDPRIAVLSDIETKVHAGIPYEGRWYFEYDETADREAQLWASYSNRSSFWLTKECLVRALMHAGFDTLFEQHDWTADQYRHYATVFPRAMFVAVRSSAFASKG